MSDHDWNEIETALASAEDIGILSKRGRSVRSSEQATILQHYSERIGARLAAEDRSDLDQIREEYQAAGKRFNDAEKDRAIERSSGRLAMLQASIAASREATEDIMSRKSQASDSELPRDWIVLDVARYFRTTGQVVVDERGTGSALEPWDNRLKVETRWPSVNNLGHNQASAGFVFLWTNPNSYSVVLDVESWIALNGFCTVRVDGGIFAYDSTFLYVGTYLTPAVPSGGIFPFPQSGQTVAVDEVSVHGGGFLGPGEIQSKEVAGYDYLTYHYLVVPGGQLAVFEVGSYFSAGADDSGFAKADFMSGDFHILCPFVRIAIV